jgi:2-oxoglutarate ferredoxin oxidoreductase subunit delta
VEGLPILAYNAASSPVCGRAGRRGARPSSESREKSRVCHSLVEKDRCKGCGLCVSACQSHVLAMSHDINARGYFFPVVEHPDECNACRHCTLVCPDVAIQVEHKGKPRSGPRCGGPPCYCQAHPRGHPPTGGRAIDALGIRERTVGVAVGWRAGV